MDASVVSDSNINEIFYSVDIVLLQLPLSIRLLGWNVEWKEEFLLRNHLYITAF